jgi:hypothetical protein
MKYLGHVFLHQMYPFERFITVLKKYVRNRSHPEGCMVQGWVTEEVIEFDVDYMNLQAIGKPISLHEGRLSGKGHEVTLLSMSIMSYTPKHISQFYNNLF